MIQDDVKADLRDAADCLGAAYWRTRDSELRQLMMGLEIDLDAVLSRLGREGFEGRPRDVAQAHESMERLVLPTIEAIEQRVRKIKRPEREVDFALFCLKKLPATLEYFANACPV